ncbi:MAG: carboxymuconolactone decarboxylase family protein [Gemmatimonadaceae bacterium]
MPPANENHVDGNPQPQRARLDFVHIAPEAVRAQRGLEAYIRGCGLEHSLLELVKLRASMINGCAYCVDMHTKDARFAGETEQRLYAVAVWHDVPFFTPRERAALAWTDALTAIAREEVSDELFQQARSQFSEKELVDLTMAVITINGWNRLSVSFRTPVGDYVPGSSGKVAAAASGSQSAAA